MPTQSEARPEQNVSPEEALSYPREVLVALQAAGSPLSPISLITELSGEQMASLPIESGMAVHVSVSSADTPVPPLRSGTQPGGMPLYSDTQPGGMPLHFNTQPGGMPLHSDTQPDDLPLYTHLPEAAESVPSLFLSVGPRCRFRIDAGTPADLRLVHTFPEADLDTLQQRIFDTLALRDAGSFELLFTAPERASEIPFLAAAQKRLADAESALSPNRFAESGLIQESLAESDRPREAYAKAARSLSHLIGLGLGLTPGGDDFLCGVLAGIRLCGLDAHPFSLTLRREISDHLDDTNKISTAFLACALENQFSQAVNELRPCFPAKKILHIFREIGHSSGTDTLCGIFYMLHLRKVF